MATTTSAINSLDSTYTSLINYQIQLESAPLTQLQTQQSALKLQRAVYTDFKTKLEALRTSTKSLISTDPFYSLKAGRTVSVTNNATGTTVISAAASNSAIAGTYDIDKISLALADRVKSDEQEYSDQALSKTGSIFIGGLENRQVEKTIQAVKEFGTGNLSNENGKLVESSYFVETKKNDESGKWQFRLVNSSGTSQVINGSDANGWQNIPTSGGVYDTGRGLTINFNQRTDLYVTTSKAYGTAANVSFSGAEGTFLLENEKNTSNTNTGSFINITSSDSIAAGQKELGNNSYFVETQKNTSGAWQFRLVDSEGNAAKIADGSSTTSFTNAWQNFPTSGSTYSTGRGINIDFGNDPEQYVGKSKLFGATSVNYQAKAAEIKVTADMSLNDIANAINSGTFGSGNEINASVVNKQLVLSSKLTGYSHKIQASGSVLEDLGVLSSGSFKNIMQEAKDATFTVNGLAVARSQNSLLTDVISGVTLNLASDAQDKSATLNIASDITSSKNAVSSFITNFNTLQTYISAKLAVTKNADNTYSRGALSGDQSIVSLRNSLYSMVNSSDATATVYKSLKDIGITVNSSLTMAITDSTKLETAMKTNYSDVMNVVDRVMTSVNSKLDKYTGTTSYVDQLIKANDSKTKNVATSITSMNKRLDARKESLNKYYVDVQAQMDLLTNTQNTNSSWITSLYASLYN